MAYINRLSDINNKFDISIENQESTNNKLTNIVFVEIETIPSLSTLQLRVDQQSFLDVLDKNLETLEKFEEYELCAEILRLKDKIAKLKAKKTRTPRKNRSIDDLIKTIKDL